MVIMHIVSVCVLWGGGERDGGMEGEREGEREGGRERDKDIHPAPLLSAAPHNCSSLLL